MPVTYHVTDCLVYLLNMLCDNALPLQRMSDLPGQYFSIISYYIISSYVFDYPPLLIVSDMHLKWQVLTHYLLDRWLLF